jgi:hypothetical protein
MPCVRLQAAAGETIEGTPWFPLRGVLDLSDWLSPRCRAGEILDDLGRDGQAEPGWPVSSSGIPPISRGNPTERPISFLIQAMAVALVPMSGPGMYFARLRMAAAKVRTNRSLF